MKWLLIPVVLAAGAVIFFVCRGRLAWSEIIENGADIVIRGGRDDEHTDF